MKYTKKIFATNLSSIMKKKKLSFMDLGQQIYNYGSGTDLWKNLDYFGRAKYVRKLRNWANAKIEGFPTTQNLIILCDILNCDMNYLFSEDAPIEFNTQQVSAYLSLNFESIERIKNYSPEMKDLICRMITNTTSIENGIKEDSLKFLLLTLYNYVWRSRYSNIVIKSNITDSTETITDSREVKSFMKACATDDLKLILHIVEQLYSNDIDNAMDNTIKILELEIELEKTQSALKEISKKQ